MRELQGFYRILDRDRIVGRAEEVGAPGRPVPLVVVVDGRELGEVSAVPGSDPPIPGQEPSAPAEVRGEEPGRFEFVIPGGLSPDRRHVVELRREEDGAVLERVPWILEPSAGAGEPAAWRGHLDSATPQRLVGWAQEADGLGGVSLEVVVDGHVVAEIVANRHRGDLQAFGIGDGRHGFEAEIPGELSPLVRHVVSVRRAADGAELPDSPVSFETAATFDAGVEQAVGLSLAALRGRDEQERALAFLAGQADRLAQRLADAEGQRSERATERMVRRRWGPLAGTMASLPETSPRALLIDEHAPRGGHDAGSEALLSHARALQQLGYAVSLTGADEDARSEPAASALSELGITLCGAPLYGSVEDVLRRQAGCLDVVYLHRANVAARYLALARHYNPRARLIYSVADLHHVRLERQAVAEERPELKAAGRHMRLVECTAAWQADAVISHSSFEVELLRRAVPDAKVYQVPWAVPDMAGPTPFEARRGVAFVGFYGHAPNRDAARWLVEEVMPLVWAVNPAIECLLAGADMPPAVHGLQRPGVTALGHVPDLARDLLGRVRLTVAPLRYGAGLKGKVLASLAAGVPCIMTSIAAEGLDLPEPLSGLVGDDPQSLARLISSLYLDAGAHQAVSAAGRALVGSRHSEAAVVEALRPVVEGRRPHPVADRARQAAG